MRYISIRFSASTGVLMKANRILIGDEKARSQRAIFSRSLRVSDFLLFPANGYFAASIESMCTLFLLESAVALIVT